MPKQKQKKPIKTIIAAVILISVVFLVLFSGDFFGMADKPSDVGIYANLIFDDGSYYEAKSSNFANDDLSGLSLVPPGYSKMQIVNFYGKNFSSMNFALLVRSEANINTRVVGDLSVKIDGAVNKNWNIDKSFTQSNLGINYVPIGTISKTEILTSSGDYGNHELTFYLAPGARLIVEQEITIPDRTLILPYLTSDDTVNPSPPIDPSVSPPITPTPTMPHDGTTPTPTPYNTFYTPTPTPYYSPTPTPAPSYIFSNGFEDGFASWTGGRAYGVASASYSITSSSHSGSSAGEFSVYAQSTYAESDVRYSFASPYNVGRITAYVNLASLQGFQSQGYINIIQLEDPSLNLVAGVRVQNIGGTNYWIALGRNGGQYVKSTATMPVTSGYVQVQFDFSIYAGSVQVTINGAVAGSLSGLDMSSYSGSRVKMGITDKPSSATVSGAETIAATVRFDDVTIN